MTAYLLLLLSTALVNNVVLVKFLGLCPFMGVSRNMDSALGMGLATTFVITLACAATWLRSASLRTSAATTAKPLPCSPALAASIAAFKASRLVW